MRYDYTLAGADFITICTQDRACLFGDVVGGEMRLNAGGRVVVAEWETLPGRFPGVAVDAFVVMPPPRRGRPRACPRWGNGCVPGGATTRVAPTRAAMGFGPSARPVVGA